MRDSKRLWPSFFRRSVPRRNSVAVKNTRLKLEVLEDRRLLSLSVGNLVWNDLNSNGLQDSGEPGVAGAVVEVFQSDDATIGNADDVSCGLAVTDSTGDYSLDGLAAGTNYYLNVRPPAGYSFTTEGAGGDGDYDSDVNASGVSSMFSLSADVSRTDLDAGLVGSVPQFGFAAKAGGVSYRDSAYAVAVDAAGNSFVVGNFVRTCDFDPGPGVYSLVNAASYNAFVAKYTPGGALCWARALGTNDYNYYYGVGVDGTGSVYVTGEFANTVDFDPGQGVFNLTATASSYDAFVWKLDANGNFVWARGLGGTGADTGYGVAVASDDGVCVAGFFSTTVDFDPGPNTFNLTSAGGTDAFILKLDAAGNFDWARRMGGSGDDRAVAIAVAPGGDVCTTGYFNYTVDFDPGPSAFNLTSAGYTDAFVSKLDATGNFSWAGRIGGIGYDYTNGLAVGPDGGVCVAGSFSGTVDFDPGAGIYNLVCSSSNRNPFAAKIDSADNFAWARAYATNDGFATEIAVATDGAVYVTGDVGSSIDLDPGPGTFNLICAGGYDAFVSKLGSDGNFISGWRYGAGGLDTGYGLALGGDGSVFVVGALQATVDFDPGPGTFNLTGDYDGDMYVVKFRTNHAPLDVTLAPAVVPAQARRETGVGQLSASDPDPDESFTYELLDSAGGRFVLDGSVVRVGNTSLLDVGSYNITLRVRDCRGTIYEKTLPILVTATPPQHSIGDRVWNDFNGNGLQDAGEPGIASAVVLLMQSTDAIADNGNESLWSYTVTDANGNYSFSNLWEGLNYYVVFRPSVGYAFATQDAGVDDAVDSDADAVGRTAAFTVTAGTGGTDLDAGLTGAAPAFGWAIKAGSTGQLLTTDASENIYVAGNYWGSQDFDPGPGVYNLIGDTNYSSQYMAKYSAAGSLIWARNVAGSIGYAGTASSAIAVNSDGSFYVTGQFSGTADFDPGLSVVNLTSVGDQDIFVLKLDADGNFIWVRSAGGTQRDFGNAIALGPDGSICITGSFQKTVDFDPGPAAYSLAGDGYGDLFIWKLDANGSFVWARKIGESNSSESGQGLVAAADGSIYTTGYFTYTVDFDPGAGTVNLTAPNNYIDAFILKLDAAGNYVWAQQVGGAKGDMGTGIALGADGCVYTTGTFGAPADFDPGAGVCTLASGSVFALKLDAAGNFVWARSVNSGNVPSDGSTYGGIAVAPDGSAYITASFQGAQDFDPGPGVFTLTNVGWSDAFVSKLDAAGNFAWACQTVGTTISSSDKSLGIALAPDGSVLVAGKYSDVADFDPRAGTFNLVSGGGGFVWKLLPDNHAPVDVTLSPATVYERSPKYTVVGQLSGSDADPNESFTYELLDSAGGRFEITGSLLRVEDPALLDHDAAASHDVRIRVRDSFGVSYEKTITIAVDKVTETRSVGDRVWNDLNGNGLQDAGEPGVPGAVVEVFQSLDGTIGNADDVSWGQTATDAAGQYTFGGLYPGINYYLVFRTPQGYLFTAQNAGADDSLDSDADSSGYGPLFTLSSGVDLDGLDAGMTGSSPGFGLAIVPGTTYTDSGQAVTTDADGNVYVTGCFQATADFDPGPGVYNLTSAYSVYSTNVNYYADVFVAKYSSTGALYWARHAGNTSAAGDGACGYGIVVGPDGSVYTTGQYGNTTDFDPGLDTFTLPQNSNTEAFVWKLDAGGNFVWARHMGGTSWDRGLAIALAPDGGICTTGYFTGTADFDPGPGVFNLVTGTSNYRDGIYVSKLDANGDFLWACTPAGSVNGQPNGVAVAPDGGVYVIGTFYGTADFDPGAGTFSLTSASNDVFVWKLGAAGQFVWADKLGGSASDYGTAVTVAPDGSVCTTGYFVGTADFDPCPGVANLTSVSSSYADVFVAKLNSAGTLVWARGMGGSSDDLAYGIAVGSDGSVFTTGIYRGTADFDPGLASFNLTSAGLRDVFVSRLDSSGNFVSAFGLGGTSDDYGYGIAVGPDDSVYTIGSFQGAADLDPGAGTYSISSAGYSDIFVSKLWSNHSPVANAGGPYIVHAGQPLTLDGSASTDPDTARGDTIVSYAWDIGDDGTYEYSVVSPSVPWDQLSGLPFNTNIPLRLLVTDSSGFTGVDTTVLRLDVPLPTVTDIVIDDGSAQRSMIASLTISFDTLVSIDEGAFSVARQVAGGSPVTVAATISQAGGYTQVMLQFSGDQTAYGSLKDGDYQLAIHGDKINDAASGFALDGNGDGQPGGDYVFGNRLFDAFFRFFGDSDGDRDVDNLDFARFRSSYNKQAGDPAYAACFDNNADGSVNSLDFDAFRLNYLTRLSTTLASGDLANLTLMRGDDGLVHVYRTGTTIDAAAPRMSASPTGDVPGQLILCDSLTVDFSRGDPIGENGVSFSGASLHIVGDSSNDDVTITDSAIIRNGSAPLYYANASDFTFDLGEGENSLTVSGMTLNIQQDNAISAGVAVTVDRGVLDFKGHSREIGNLVVKNGGCAMVTAIENTTTTVESGTLTATSIVCDTLTIGGGSAMAGSASRTADTRSRPTENDVVIPAANAPAQVANVDKIAMHDDGAGVPSVGAPLRPVAQATFARTLGTVAEVSMSQEAIHGLPTIATLTPKLDEDFLADLRGATGRELRFRVGAWERERSRADTAATRRAETFEEASSLRGRDRTRTVVGRDAGDVAALAALRAAIEDYQDWHRDDTLDIEPWQATHDQQESAAFAEAVDVVLAEI